MSKDLRLALVLGANLAMVLALVLVGVFAHSLGVLASGADYLGDALGTGLSLAALRVSRRGTGHPRAPLLAAAFNSGLLLAITLLVAAGAVHRLAAGTPVIHAVPVVVASLVAALVMVACALILGDVGGDLNMESVLLDTVADAAAALGVAASGAVILLVGGAYWLDSAVALTIALVVALHAARLLGRAAAELRGPARA